MINGKDWMAGQNWITQFQLCCLHDGHCDLIGTIGNGIDAKRLINDTRRTFVDPIICDDERWIERACDAENHCIDGEYKLCY